MATITIHMNNDDLINLRFAYSPLLELSTSYKVLTQPSLQAFYHQWVEEACRALYDVELPYLSDLFNCKRYIPDFLTPTPTSTSLTLEDEIARMMELPADLIRQNIQFLVNTTEESAIRQEMIAYPHATLLKVIDELRLYWKRTLSHHWPRMSSVLEGDVLYRARKLALDGAPAVLADLHPSLSYTATELIIDKPGKDLPCCELDLNLDGRGLQLVPAIFSASHLYWQLTPEWQPMVVYTGRGAGLWRRAEPDADQSLEVALGAGRASVLRVLHTPSNTGELARKLQLTDGAVSQHLNRLNQAGLVEPHRSGKRVFYHLTTRGEQLLALFDATG